MNKRTVLFMLLVAASFVGMNLFFSHQRDAKNRETLKRQEAKSAQQEAQARALAESQRVTLSELPITPLYADPEKTLILSYGIQVGSSVLTLAWDEPLPELIYTKDQKLHLLSRDSVKEGVVLYAPISFEKVEIAALPDTGIHCVQLITFPAGGLPQIYLGSLKEGVLSLSQERPSENALVLYKGRQGWLPVGFYEWRNGIFVVLQNLPLISSYISHCLAAPPPCLFPQNRDFIFYKTHICNSC